MCVPEHSHEIVLESVRPMLNLNNPQNIQDPVFALLGDAAAAAGAGTVTVRGGGCLITSLARLIRRVEPRLSSTGCG